MYGSRLTGGGFGGCTVTLVQKDKVQDLIKHLETNYKKRTGIECISFVTNPEAGARELSFH